MANELDLSFLILTTPSLCVISVRERERNPLEETFPLGAVPRDTAEIVCLQRPECST